MKVFKNDLTHRRCCGLYEPCEREGMQYRCCDRIKYPQACLGRINIHQTNKSGQIKREVKK